jgi:transposase
MLACMRTKADVWSERVRDWKASGASAEDFALGKEFTGRMLRWWAGEFVRRARAKTKSSSPIAMARVVSPGEILAEPEMAASSALAIIVGRYRVSVSRGFDESLLRDVLRVLGAEAQ